MLAAIWKALADHGELGTIMPAVVGITKPWQHVLTPAPAAEIRHA